MDILISVNEKYLDKAKTMLLSLRRRTREAVHVHLMTHALAQKSIASLDAFLRRNGMCLSVVDVTNTALDTLPLGNRHFSIEMYYRLLAQFLLPETLDRVLWLDADIVVTKDLAPFYHQSFDEKLLCACQDKSDGNWELTAIKEKLGLPTGHPYFNSGVLLLNLAELRHQTTQAQIVDLANRLSDLLTYPDQDILNTLYQGRVKYLPWQVYNYQVLYERELDPQIAAKVAIYHYVGETKPWDYHYVWPSSAPYYAVQKMRGRCLYTAWMYAKHAAWALSFALRRKLGMVK